MTAVDTASFNSEVARALLLLGARSQEIAVDALVDPSGAAGVLASLAGSASAAEEGAILRVVPELAPSAEGYGPRPADPLWLRIRSGSAEVTLAPLRLRTDPGEAERVRVERVVIATEARPCCDSPSCKLDRTVASVWLKLAREDKVKEKDKGKGKALGARRLLVAEGRDLAPDKALQKAKAVASPLARALGVPLFLSSSGGAVESEESVDAVKEPLDSDRSEKPAPALGASVLARFALRSEGDRIVIRDHASLGPRLLAKRTLLIGASLLVVAVVLWAQVARSLSGESRGASITFGALAALVSLTAYAFLGVGRFASRYAAESAPLVAFGRDRMIVAPWVGRDGAVDLRPEGRLGAAIPIGEVRAANIREREGLFVIELETDHGPMDALASDQREVVELFSDSIRRSLDDARHPKAGASARQRARAKAQA